MTATRPAAIDGGDALDGPQHCLSTDPFGRDDEPFAVYVPNPDLKDAWRRLDRDRINAFLATGTTSEER